AHALRNLPPEQRAAWIKTLPADARQHDQVQAARKDLTQIAKTAVGTFFSSRGLPQPALLGKSELWDASSYLAVFNSMNELQAKLPEPLFRKLAAPDGKALEFERRREPPATTGGVMATLSSCMCVAHSNGQRRITLYDPAVSMNPRDILQREEVKGLLHRLNRPSPPPEDVRSLQEMLNLGLPPARRIPVNGEMGPNVWTALHEFETVQVLTQSLDIVRDDQRLGATEKKAFEQRIKSQLENVRNLGDTAGIDTLLADLGQQNGLSPAGRERLQDLSAGIRQGVCSTSLKPEQMELLVRNWFGMIDSGSQYDFPEQVINHEIGHLFQGHDELIKSWAQISFSESSDGKGTEFMGKTLQQRQPGWGVKLAEKFGLNFGNGFGSDYAKVNPQEDFAESFRLFIRHPERLAKENPLKFVIMAGATGKYAGKEPELVGFLRQQGFNDLQLQNMVRILRGQNSAFVAQKTKSMVETGMGWLGAAAQVISPSLLIAKYFGYDPVDTATKGLSDRAVNVATKIADDHTPRFDLNVSTMLPGLENALAMKTEIHAIKPDQPGYVLDWISQQCAQLQSPDAQAREAARQTLDRFARDGLEALPAATRSQLPAAEQARFAKPAERAMALVLAHIHAFPQNLQIWSDRLQAAGEKLGDGAQDARARGRELRALSEQKLESLLGKDLLKTLPPAFKALLREPGMLEKLSGFFGRIDLDSGKLQQQVLDQVRSRAEAFVSAVHNLLDPKKSEFITTLAGDCFTPDAQGKLRPDGLFADLSLESMQQLFAAINRGSPDTSLKFSEELGHHILDGVAIRLNAWLSTAGPQELNSSNEDFRKQLAKSLYEELTSQFQDFNDVMGIM
ncbi:MAG: hypothetical protein ACAI44_38660, partial [Candidatus Sericytochromatia bacterium]